MSRLFPELDDGPAAAPPTPPAPRPAGQGATAPASSQPGAAAVTSRGGPTALLRFEKLFGLPGAFGFRVASAVAIDQREVTFALDKPGHGEATLRLCAGLVPDRFAATRHLSLGYRASALSPELKALLGRLAVVLRDVPMAPLCRLILDDPAPGSPDFDIEDSLIFSFGSGIAWRNFYEGHELYRGSCQRFAPGVVNVNHTDIECHYAGPSHENGTVSFFNYLRPSAPSTEAHGSPTRGGSLSLLTDVSDRDVIKGGGTKLDAVLDQIAAMPEPPKMVVVSSACISLVTGDDLEASAARLERKLHVPVIHIGNASTPGAEMLRRVRQSIGFLEVDKRPRSVNLVGLPQARGTGELLALLAAVGVEVNCRVLPEIDPIAFQRYMAAELQVFYDWDWNEQHYQQIVGGLPLPSLSPPSPFGIAGSRAWLSAIAGALGLGAVLDEVWRERAAAAEERFAALQRRAAGYRLGFIVSEGEEGRRLAARRLMGVPMRELVAEMGFHIEWLVYRPAEARGGAAPVLDVGADEVRVFSTPSELERCLRQSEAAAFYSELFFDRRLTRTGHNIFSMSEIEMGVEGAVRSAERLLGRCATPFYRRYARYLGKPFATAHDGEGGDGRG